jgi:hypothetical protein
MKIVAAITSPHQDDVIERVLKHMKIWDPPWKRERRVRGPPSAAYGSKELPDEREEPSAAEATEAQRDIDEYAVDPPWRDEL